MSALRIAFIPVAAILYLAFQLWVIVDQFPSYARFIWVEWRINTRELVRYCRIAFGLEKAP